jgi:hypothetical protein
MDDRGTLATELKKLIEGLHPDIRAFFRPSLLGKVVAVHDDDSDPDTYYRMDVVVGAGPSTALRAGEENGEQGLSLPNVPCASLFAQNGYGVWALPEVGAEVTVSFHDGDVTRPYVESPLYYGNKAPPGFRSGTFAIRGKHGQKIELKAGSNEIVLSCASLKLIAMDKRQEQTVGDEAKRVRGDRIIQVDGDESHSCGTWTMTIDRAASIESASITEKTKGDLVQAVGGSLRQSIVGTLSQQIAGGSSTSTTFNKREVIGGGYEIVVAATPGIVPTPPQAAYQVLVNLGALALDAMGGQINIGANILTPPIMINIGSTASGPVNLGGLGAVGQPAVVGLQLMTMLSQLLAALLTPLQIGNLGAPTAPHPGFVAQIAALQGQLQSILSTKVFVAPV